MGEVQKACAKCFSTHSFPLGPAWGLVGRLPSGPPRLALRLLPHPHSHRSRHSSHRNRRNNSHYHRPLQ